VAYKQVFVHEYGHEYTFLNNPLGMVDLEAVDTKTHVTQKRVLTKDEAERMIEIIESTEGWTKHA
jgi:hypothetical protein